MSVNLNLALSGKSCIFVLQRWGIGQIWSIPLYFTTKMDEKIQDFVKISRRLVEKSQGFVEIIQGFF
jgi:hypothetical protein